MIFDSHVYCFESFDSERGYSSKKEHLNWVQAAHARHQQPAVRIPDGVPGPSEILDPEGSRDLDNLPDVDFRINKPRGRVVWNYQGHEYTKYFLPPNLRDTEFTMFGLDSEMHYASVDAGLLHTDPMLVRDSFFLKEIIERFPGRMFAMAPVDEWRIIAETDSILMKTERAIKEHNLHAIKFCPPLCYTNSDAPWDDGPYRPFWELATSLDVPIFFTLGSGPADIGRRKRTLEEERQGYLNELGILMNWMARYPDTVCSLTHGFPWRSFIDNGIINLPNEIWEPFKGSNCNLEVCFPVRIGDLYDYPYKEIWPTLEAMIKNIGVNHLLWGTDMPFQNRFCTYTQSRKWIENHFSPHHGLAREELDLLMGDTVARILGVGNSDQIQG